MAQAIDPHEAWEAFERRDRAFDGRFVVAVRSTHIYCKPSCAARRPRRENVSFLPDGAAARAAGYRACRRCLPDSAARDRAAVAQAAAMIAAATDVPPLDALAAAVGYAPHHFHRLFRRATGLTPAAYARALRADRAAESLRGRESVTAAIYDAGYATPSRFYADAARLGMTPAAWAHGGAGETIRWARVDTPLGGLLVAATARGPCHVAFDEGEAALHRRFPAATLRAADACFARAVGRRLADMPHDAALPRTVREVVLREAARAAVIEIG